MGATSATSRNWTVGADLDQPCSHGFMMDIDTLQAIQHRSRYTVLDVTREIGWFDELVDKDFAPGELWA